MARRVLSSPEPANLCEQIDAASLGCIAGYYISFGCTRQASIRWLRHTFGTRLSLANVDVRTIMMEMGHSDIRTSLQYISPDHAARFEQVDRAFE
jgi:site-specific recombinase XerD